MNTKIVIARTTLTFVALAMVGIFMAVGARTMTDAVDQSILISVGSALFGGALAFFLVRVFSIIEK
jgi:hypothetical protein